VVPDSLLHTGAAVCALTLLGFAGQANATPRPALDGASGLTILAQDEENAEVQNRVEPETDNGVPGGLPTPRQMPCRNPSKCPRSKNRPSQAATWRRRSWRPKTA